MDPANNQLIPATAHHQIIHEQQLHRLTNSWQRIPSHQKCIYRNRFLLKRANLFWILGRYEKCILDLDEVNSNGLSLRFPNYFAEGLEIYRTWKYRASEILESSPSLAIFLIDWCIPHAITSQDQVQFHLYKGVATFLSGDQVQGMKLIEGVSGSYPDIIKNTVLSWKKGGIKALGDEDFTKAKNLFQRSLILIHSETSQNKEKCCLLGNLATAYFHLNEYQTALDKGEEAYALNPVSSHDEAERWKERAEEILVKGNFVLTIEYCKMAFKLTPEANSANLRCSLLSCRSVAYAKTSHHEKAVEDAEECLILTSTTDQSMEMYIKFMVFRGNSVLESHPSLAELFFTCSFLHAVTPFDEARCLLYKGVAFWLSNKQAQGMTVIEEASLIYPDIIKKTVLTWKQNGIKALEAKDFTKAKNLFQRSLIVIQSETSQHKEIKCCILSSLATAYFHLNEYQTALDKGEEAYALKPVSSHEEAKRWKERIEKIPRRDSFELLIGYLTLAIKFVPEDENFGELRFWLLSSRCDTYVKMNQHKQALEDAEKCLEIEPNWLKGHRQLGYLLDHLGRHHEAVHSYCKAFVIADVPEKSDIILQILLVSEKISDGTADVVLDVPTEIVNNMIKQCVCDRDWAKLRLLFIGGVGPQKYDYGKGGLADGCDASDVPLELIVNWGIDNSVDHLPEFLDELLKHGTSISGSPGCNESPLEIVDRRQDKGVLQVFEKYKKSQGIMWRKKGAKAYDSGNFEKAVFAYERSIRCEMEFQERVEVHLALSKAYFESRKYQNSISTCDKALEVPEAKKEVPSPSIKPLLFELVFLRGSAQYHLNDLKQALQDGIKATTINPDEVTGYILLVSCYKGLQRHSEMMSALNECLKRERNSEEQWKFLKEAIEVAMDLPEEATDLTAQISGKLLKRLHKEAVSSKNWNLIRLLYLGGGGPEKHQQGKGGIATGRVSASNIEIEDVISTKFKGRRETLSVLLEQGASVNGLLEKSNPLVSAVKKGQVGVAETLLKYSANPCVKTDDNQPLVHKVTKKAIDTGDSRMLECFLGSHHPSIQNVKDSAGNSLYHLATMKGKSIPNQCRVIRCLINANVDPTIKNKQGRLPTNDCKKNDDRRKMISKFIKERDEKFHRFPTQTYLSAKNVTQAPPQQSTEQDLSSTSKTTVVSTSKSESKKIKKKDVRKELEELIENFTITDRKVDMYFDDEVKLEVSSLPEAATGPHEEEVLARESAGEEKREAVIEEIDETIFDDLLWEVDFSDKFKKHFGAKKIQQDTKRRILDKIIMLAQGRWNAFSRKRLEGQPKQKGILLFESKLTKGARILWEKTIAFSPRCSTDKDSRIYTEIIRVWDVVMDHGNLDHEIENVVNSIVKSNERGSQCAMKVKLKAMNRKMEGLERGVTYPTLYQKCDSGNSHTEQNIDDKMECFPPASTEKNEYNILKFYSFTSSLMEALLNDEGKSDINFPFKVTEREHAIINLQPKPPCSIILLGRSGTGKTTCCLYRLWTEFQNYWKQAATVGPQFPSYTPSSNNCSTKEGTSASFQGVSSSVSDGGTQSAMGGSSEKLEHFHPLFITKNDVLCNEVRKNFKELINTNSAIKSLVVCEDSLPNRIQDFGETSWPLVVSSRDWLLLLDASLAGDSFFQRKPDGSMQNKIIGWGKESKHMRVLPVDGEDQKTREVQEVTNAEDIDHPQHRRKRKPIAAKSLKIELTYQVFRDNFYPKMERKIKKKIHPTLVWTEIRSFIKGSAEALNTPQGFLSRDKYKEIGRKRAPYFLGDRDLIYDVFESYQKFLTSNGMFDEADLVHNLHIRLQKDTMSWSIHEVYVDETQDFTQAELSLLIRCCRYPNRMFFTGDTAQSITKGIAFRFEDIKTLLYNLKSYDKAINVPESLFQLTHNYRSHSGIIKLACSVVKLLERFFPQSFDKLEEDTALFDGPKPILLESCSSSDLAMVLRGNKRQTSRIEFGAHQAVLVVSEEARDNMPEELKHGLVLTIYEAKGLEFDDVLVYNFFKDSQAKEPWRIVTSYSLEEQQKQTQTEAGTTGLVEIPAKSLSFTSRPLVFDYEQHKVLNPEFKLLYTAITRARVNIWFFDEDVKARAPVFEYFQRSGLVQMNVLSNTEETDEASLTQSAFAESSTKTEWRAQGIHYFNQEKWTLAAKCFTNAGDEVMTNQSKALRMAQEATAKQDNNMLCEAAVALLKCDMMNKAADCLNKAGEKLLLKKLNERMGKA